MKDIDRKGLTISRRAVTAAALAMPFVPVKGWAASAEPVKIGWLPSLTGALATAAIGFDHGVRFGVEQANKGGGIDGRPIELVSRDTGSDPTNAVNLAQQLVFTGKVNFVAGPVNSGESLATVPIIARAGIPNLVPLHSDFDRLTIPWFQCGQVGPINQDSDTPGHPRAA